MTKLDIEKIKNAFEYGAVCDHDSGFLCEHRMKWLADNISLLDENGGNAWISVKNHLPDDDSKVLVYENKYNAHKYSNIFFGYYFNKKWHWEDANSNVVEYQLDDYWDISHWMPLPEPPKITKNER